MRQTLAISRHIPSLRLLSLLFLVLWLLNACANGTPSSTQTGTGGKGVYTSSSPAASGTATPKPTISLPDEGVAASIPVSANPDITVESGSAPHLSIVGMDTQTISTDSYALPYEKKGNTVLINFGQTLSQPLVIKIPRKANLTITLTAGNVSIDTLQGQMAITLADGTLQVKNFTPQGTDSLEVNSGTINVTFTKDTSCRLQAQTGFGEIVSGYAAIQEKRNGMQASTTGTIGAGSGVKVSLITQYGSITIGPA